MTASREPPWTTRLDTWPRPRERDPEWEAQERKWARQSAARKANQQRAIDSWVAWRDKVMRDPDAYFGKTANARILQ